MFKSILFIGAILFAYSSFSQRRIVVHIEDSLSNEKLGKVRVHFLEKKGNFFTDNLGNFSFDDTLPSSEEMWIQKEGYLPKAIPFSFSGLNRDTFYIFLIPDKKEEEEEVIVTSTRNSRSISNQTTRVEVLAGEELSEKANMRPGDIRMILSESTGIQTQQISATSASSSIRIQGLDGRYTQLLKDGFPLFGGFSGGLGLMQTPPLDLQQVEIIKGAASTLYGGGAIAGLVNLISKVPKEKPEYKFLINATSAGGVDISGFYSQKFNKNGWTILVTHNKSLAYAPDNETFTAIPKTSRWIFNPKLFLYIDSFTTMTIGINSVYENRIGGLTDYIKNGEQDGYFEKNITKRIGYQMDLKHQINDVYHWEIKNAINYFDRQIDLPIYQFRGRQWSTFSEANMGYSRGNANNILGLNIYSDNFSEIKKANIFPSRSYTQTTIGFFEQYSNVFFQKWKAELGIRGDYTYRFGWSILPRLSLMHTITPQLTTRIGGGMGYKTPTIFLEEAEKNHFRNVLPISSQTNQLDKSMGLNWDFNYKTYILDDIKINFNQLFFYTRIKNPLHLQKRDSSELLEPVNITGNLKTIGWETNVRVGFKNFSYYFGYTFTNSTLDNNGVKLRNTLSPRTKLNHVLMYEIEKKWKIGLEAYYFSRQYLADNSWGRSYWLFGFMAEKYLGKISVYINFENLTDVRQTKFGRIYSGTLNAPNFKDIYAPLDGRIINGGIKFNF